MYIPAGRPPCPRAKMPMCHGPASGSVRSGPWPIMACPGEVFCGKTVKHRTAWCMCGRPETVHFFDPYAHIKRARSETRRQLEFFSTYHAHTGRIWSRVSKYLTRCPFSPPAWVATDSETFAAISSRTRYEKHLTSSMHSDTRSRDHLAADCVDNN